ncbi:Gfo/Idh/MocA family oxidoreductase [Amphibacillus indicireducens]|uniref:Gfo/Idh/MocA family oxidoreductase n=1 Tax=Amphibacillus indicireducens TaxID=1076330 RepID=A0ABP7V6W1_9BACI
MLNFAIIGCGRIAKFHLEGILEQPLATVKAVCDLDIKKAERLIASLSDIEIISDYRDILLDPSIDVVNICTNHQSHFEITRAAIEAGKHVIIEKPVTLSLDEADILIEAQKKNNVKATVVFQNRFNQSIELTKKALDEGMFGRLSHGVGSVRWSRTQDYYLQDPWRGKAYEKDGILMNQSIHTIDLLTYLMGPVKKVTGQVKTAFYDIEMENVGLATLEFENSAIGLFEGAGTIYPTDLEGRINIFGETGTVMLGGMSANKIEAWRFTNDYETEQEELLKKLLEEEANAPTVYGFGHEKVIKDMIDAIKEDRQPKVSLQDGKNALAVVLAIYESAANDGMPVYCHAD